MSKTSKKQAAREHYESIAQSRREKARTLSAVKVEKDAVIAAKFKAARVTDVPAIVSKAIADARLELSQAVEYFVSEAEHWSNRVQRLAEAVYVKSPKLVHGHIGALAVIALQTPLRPVEEWEPQGKGRDAHLRSLAAHLFAKYPMPAFLWSAFSEPVEVAQELAPVVVRIAAGESFVKMMKDGELSVPLTKKQCHELLRTPSTTPFLAGVRRVQVQAHGGRQRLFQVYRKSRPGTRLGSVREEAFWDTVIAFFAANPMLDLGQANPIIDYLAFRRNENRDFTMKGRTVAAVVRGMEEWHGSLARKPVGNNTYEPSGFRAGLYERTYRTRSGNYVTDMWRMDEILTAKELAAEGSVHGHCVYSYDRTIQSGRTSIWSLRHMDTRKITVEVSNQNRRIVQARGKHNRKTEIDEFRMINKWAEENRLTVSINERW